jgi:hypothetical protein
VLVVGAVLVIAVVVIVVLVVEVAVLVEAVVVVVAVVVGAVVVVAVLVVEVVEVVGVVPLPLVDVAVPVVVVPELHRLCLLRPGEQGCAESEALAQNPAASKPSVTAPTGTSQRSLARRSARRLRRRSRKSKLQPSTLASFGRRCQRLRQLTASRYPNRGACRGRLHPRLILGDSTRSPHGLLSQLILGHSPLACSHASRYRSRRGPSGPENVRHPSRGRDAFSEDAPGNRATRR